MEDDVREQLLKTLFEYTNKMIHKNEKDKIVSFEVFKSRHQGKTTRDIKLIVQAFQKVFGEW